MPAAELEHAWRNSVAGPFPITELQHAPTGHGAMAARELLGPGPVPFQMPFGPVQPHMRPPPMLAGLMEPPPTWAPPTGQTTSWPLPTRGRDLYADDVRRLDDAHEAAWRSLATRDSRVHTTFDAGGDVDLEAMYRRTLSEGLSIDGGVPVPPAAEMLNSQVAV